MSFQSPAADQSLFRVEGGYGLILCITVTVERDIEIRLLMLHVIHPCMPYL